MPHSGGYIVWVHNAFAGAAERDGEPVVQCLRLRAVPAPARAIRRARAVPAAATPEPHGAHGASWWRELAPDVIGSCLRLAVVALAAGVNVLGTSVVAIGMVAFMFLVSTPLLALVLASYAAPHTAPLAPFTPSLQEPWWCRPQRYRPLSDREQEMQRAEGQLQGDLGSYLLSLPMSPARFLASPRERKRSRRSTPARRLLLAVTLSVAYRNTAEGQGQGA